MTCTDLWLDDERKPPSFADCGIHWTWAKTCDEAIALMQTGTVVFASLDHDLCDEHYFAFDTSEHYGTPLDTSQFKEKTGYDFMLWMAENNVWPVHGIRIHTMNTARKPVMIDIVQRHYDRTFQHQYKGTHTV
jgi:hypothetical protein